MTTLLTLDPHEVLDRGLEALIGYVESVHALSGASPEGDELLELLIGAQEVARERQCGSAPEPGNGRAVAGRNGGRLG